MVRNIAYTKFQTMGIFHAQCTSYSYEDIIRDWKLPAKIAKIWETFFQNLGVRH